MCLLASPDHSTGVSIMTQRALIAAAAASLLSTMLVAVPAVAQEKE